MGYEPTIIASWVTIALNAFAARGADTASLCQKAGISPDELKNPFKPVPISKAISLWQQAEALIGNRCLGLESARFINFTTFHALGYAVIASSNLYNAFNRITAYSNAATDCGQAFLREEGDHFIVGLTINPRSGDLPDGCVDMTLGIFRFMCRLLHDEKPAITKLEMPRASLSHPEIYAKVFTDNIHLNRPHYAIHFSREYFLKPIPTGNEAIAKANDRFVEELLQTIHNQSVAYHVRQQIQRLLEQAKVGTIESVAKSLAMSERQLQRCLKEENTNFRTLLDQERKKLAEQMVVDSSEPVIAIAHRLGFSDSANFTRAFKRWFCCNPMDYRAGHKR